MLAERAGYPVTLVDGEYGNIKITTREDMPMENRTGTGFDVHAFAPGRKLMLGGVEIPYDRGLDGHSDADRVRFTPSWTPCLERRPWAI